MRTILKMMRLWIDNQSICFSAIKDGVKENEFKKFILCTLQGMDQRGRCTKIAVIQARENKTATRAEVVSTERSGRMMN